MSNRVYDYFVGTNLEDRAVSRFVAKAVMKLANDNVESSTLSGDRAALWILSQ